jgi:hypothetical protein
MSKKFSRRMLSLMLVLCLSVGLVSITVPAAAIDNENTIVSGIKNATDDMEEWITGADAGNLDYDSSDIEIGLEKPGTDDGYPQYVGLRFADLAIPAGATITNAYIQFTVDEVKSPANPFNVNIYAEDADNSVTFNNGTADSMAVSQDISSRVRTVESVAWAPDNTDDTLWTAAGDSGELQRTPDLTSLVQAVVNKSGWVSGHAVTFIMTGTGNRTAVSYENNPAQAAVLHLTYTYDGALDQTAPAGLVGIAPTSEADNDGRITGTTADMEYKRTSDSEYTPCTGTSVIGLSAGTYDVRYKEKPGYNPGQAASVTVPTYSGTATPYAYENLTLQPGKNETELNLCWYSGTGTTGSCVKIAKVSEMAGGDRKSVV